MCLALDNIKTINELEETVNELSPAVGLFKIGKETFTRLGSEAVKLVQRCDANVFLDLKYHDIPNTVKGASYGRSGDDESGGCRGKRSGRAK